MKSVLWSKFELTKSSIFFGNFLGADHTWSSLEWGRMTVCHFATQLCNCLRISFISPRSKWSGIKTSMLLHVFFLIYEHVLVVVVSRVLVVIPVHHSVDIRRRSFTNQSALATYHIHVHIKLDFLLDLRCILSIVTIAWDTSFVAIDQLLEHFLAEHLLLRLLLLLIFNAIEASQSWVKVPLWHFIIFNTTDKMIAIKFVNL